MGGQQKQLQDAVSLAIEQHTLKIGMQSPVKALATGTKILASCYGWAMQKLGNNGQPAVSYTD